MRPSYGSGRCFASSTAHRSPRRRGLSASLELSGRAMTNRINGPRSRARRAPPRSRRPGGVRVEMTDAGAESWVESTNTQAIKEKLVASALTKDEQHQLNGLLRKLMLSFEHTSG